MNRDFGLDLSEITKNIDNAEVISIIFPKFRKSLLVDARLTLEDRPLIKIVPMVNSLEERLRSLKKMRPTFPRPVEIAVVPWFGYVNSLVRLGVWECIVKKFVDSGNREAVRACSGVLKDLRTLEQEELLAVIKGDGYQTLWSMNKKPS